MAKPEIILFAVIFLNFTSPFYSQTGNARYLLIKIKDHKGVSF